MYRFLILGQRQFLVQLLCVLTLRSLPILSLLNPLVLQIEGLSFDVCIDLLLLLHEFHVLLLIFYDGLLVYSLHLRLLSVLSLYLLITGYLFLVLYFQLLLSFQILLLYLLCVRLLLH